MKLGPPPKARLDLSHLPLPTTVVLFLAAVYLLLTQAPQRLVEGGLIPRSVVMLYMGFVLLGVMIHITLDDGRIRQCRDFFAGAAEEGRARRAQRFGLLLVLPAILGWWAWGASRPNYAPPVQVFQRHPTVGEDILNRIEVPAWAAAPASWSPDAIAQGKVIYQNNCAVCHGEQLDGKGPAAEGFRYPIRPANFRDAGTIGQLTLRYVYWRLTTGGIRNQFNSAMPSWVAPSDNPDASTLHTYDLTSDEAWKVIVYLYSATGYQPRGQAAGKAAAAEGHNH